MIFLSSNEKYPKKTALALGIFDGVHLGHRAILSLAKSFSGESTAFGVFTFKTSSVKKKHGADYRYIYTDIQKERILESLGTEVIYSPVMPELSDMTGEEFAKRVLKDMLNAETVVCGEKFRFGRGALCGVRELKEFGERYGFGVKLCSTVFDGDRKISSANIKEYLENGDIALANKLLGRRYFIDSVVTEGNRIGRTISFPTANQHYEERHIIPKKGCYVTVCTAEGREYRAVTNIGVKPTVEDNAKPLAETHILDFSGDIYGKSIKTEFVEFIRPERKFSSLDDLKKQIGKDAEYAKTTKIL